MDLVELQRSAKQIRNPFKFDFVWTWNKQPVMLKGDGEWHTYVGPLAQHLAWHLFQKIKNQYHDEQIKKLRLQGDKDAANIFHVTQDIEDKIWMMITGEKMHTKEATEQLTQQAADLTELEGEVKNLEASAASSNSVTDVSSILDHANMEAMTNHNDVEVSTGHRGGSAALNEAPPAGSIDTTPDPVAAQAAFDANPPEVATAPEAPVQPSAPEATPDVTPAEQTAETPASAAQADEPAFSDLNTLDGQ